MLVGAWGRPLDRSHRAICGQQVRSQSLCHFKSDVDLRFRQIVGKIVHRRVDLYSSIIKFAPDALEQIQRTRDAPLPQVHPELRIYACSSGSAGRFDKGNPELGGVNLVVNDGLDYSIHEPLDTHLRPRLRRIPKRTIAVGLDSDLHTIKPRGELRNPRLAPQRGSERSGAVPAELSSAIHTSHFSTLPLQPFGEL